MLQLQNFPNFFLSILHFFVCKFFFILFHNCILYLDKVNGSWCDWLPVSPCSVSCGHGNQKFIRYCNCPAPENGGADCSGKTHLYNSCFLRNCTKMKGNISFSAKLIIPCWIFYALIFFELYLLHVNICQVKLTVFYLQ